MSRFLLALLLVLTTAQEHSSWQKVAPLNEEFSILMPDTAAYTRRALRLREDRLDTAQVYTALGDRVRYMVLSVDKRPEQPDSPVAELNTFARGFEQAFLGSKQFGKKTISYERDVVSQGRSGRQYRLRLDDYTGVARIFEAGYHFYVVMILAAGVESPSVKRSLESFTLGGLNKDSFGVDLATMMACSGSVVSVESSTKHQGIPPEPWQQKPFADGGGELNNGKAVSKPSPLYPEEAKAAKAFGNVVVSVLVDEEGRIARACAVNGHPLLQPAAVRAAYQARISPTSLSGQPVKVRGVLVYNFVLPE